MSTVCREDLIISMLLTLTLPKSMNIQSLEPGDAFIERSIPALCVCDALQNTGSNPGVGFVQRTPARKGGGSVLGRTWRWSPVHVTISRRELGLFWGQVVVPQPHTLRVKHHLGPYSSWILSTFLLLVSKTIHFLSMKETLQFSPQ